MFRFAESRGLATGYELVTPAQLAAADDIWLVSSVRLAAPVRALDGVQREVDDAFTADLNAYLKTIDE